MYKYIFIFQVFCFMLVRHSPTLPICHLHYSSFLSSTSIKHCLSYMPIFRIMPPPPPPPPHTHTHTHPYVQQCLFQAEDLSPMLPNHQLLLYPSVNFTLLLFPFLRYLQYCMCPPPFNCTSYLFQI